MKYRIKGTAIIGTREFLDSRIHNGFFEEAGRDIGLLDKGIVLASSWYDAEKGMRLFEVAAKTLNTSSNLLTTEAVKYGIEKDLNGIYKFFMKVGGAERVLNKSPQMARTYADYYDYDKIENENGFHVVQIKVPEILSEWTIHIIKGALSGVLEACSKKMTSFNIMKLDSSSEAGEKRVRCRLDIRY